MGNAQGDAFGNLADILQASEWQARAHEQTPPPNPGDRVMIHGLSRRTDLNGKLALVLDSAAPRFRLRVEDTGAEIKAKRQNFTRIVTAPADVVDVDRDDAGSVDTTTLLRGDCVICLGAKQATRAVVPCGHLATCEDCAPRLRMAQGRCPICRGPVCDIIRIFLPGRKEPGTALRRDVEFPLDFPFQSILTTKDAIPPEDQYCVFASMKSDRQKHIRAQRRAEQKRAKAEDVS